MCFCLNCVLGNGEEFIHTEHSDFQHCFDLLVNDGELFREVLRHEELSHLGWAKLSRLLSKVLDGNLDVNPVSFLDALGILDVHGTLFDHLGQNVVE